MHSQGSGVIDFLAGSEGAAAGTVDDVVHKHLQWAPRSTPMGFVDRTVPRPARAGSTETNK
jgi:hypothetical protein